MKNLVLLFVVSLLFSFLGFSQGSEKTHQVYFNEVPKRNKPERQPVADSIDVANFEGVEISPKIDPRDPHPELEEGEIFITNISTEYCWDSNQHFVVVPYATMVNFKKINLKTKRLGWNAYDKKGKRLKYMRPVFAKKEEIDQKKK